MFSTFPDDLGAAASEGETEGGTYALDLSSLNAEQRAAVLHDKGPLLIFAGAGSGKTRVLTYRVANLVLRHSVHPESILAVTFTNKAAKEMKERLSRIVREMRPPTWVSTFHSSCARILRANAKFLDFTPQFAIYDTSDSLSVMKRVYQRLNIDPKILEPRRVLQRIDKAKNDYKFSDSIREDRYTPRPIAEMMADAFEAYQRELLTSNAMDFGDLLCNVLTLFKLEPLILERYQDQFQYLLIDEYQDTNHVQYLLVQMLAAKNRNLCVVGDDDQSIYAFRGATIENILNFQKDFPDAKTVTLDRNYRSTKTILAAANSVIERNVRRQKKAMRTDNPNGAAVVSYLGHDENEEAEFITREIARYLEDGVSASDIAVFYRTNAQSRAVEESFFQNGIPYEIYGGHKFYDRKEIKDLLAYFRLLVNPLDNEAFLRIVNVPARGIGATSLAALIDYADSNRQSLLAALRQGLAEGARFLTTANKKKFATFADLITGLEREAVLAEAKLQGDASFDQSDALSGLLGMIAERSGYLAELKGQDSLDAESRIENIYELLAVASEFVQRAHALQNRVTLSDFVERASLSSDLDKTDGTEPVATVSLMTLHLAKGLEFDYVFLGGMEEGLLPHVRSLDDRAALEEERRLCYVGITRAKKRLYLTRAEYRDSFGRRGIGFGGASRFLSELPRDILEHRGNSQPTY